MTAPMIAGDDQRQDNTDEIVEPQGVERAPDDKPAEHIQGAVGEIRQSAGAVNKREAQCIKGQRHTIDRTVDEDVHLSVGRFAG